MICGVDEAGRGPVIGPMVIAGVIVSDDVELMELGVKDSKRLTPERRSELFEEITEISDYCIRVIPAEDIDSLRKSTSLNKIESNNFASIIQELCSEGDVAYVDSASTDEKGFGSDINSKVDQNIDIVSKHEADDTYPIVSAASIIAKVKRDEEVQKISERIGQDIGSGYPSDMKTRNFLNRWIAENDDLPPHTRRSWQTCKDLINRSKNKSLDDF
ncbi:MAG: ribonuclease HII [Candidatus Saliniplasma sp.]